MISTRLKYAALAIIVVPKSAAVADKNFFESGLSCIDARTELYNNVQSQTRIGYGGGALNISSGTGAVTVATVACPVPTTGTGAQTTNPTRVYYRDQNSRIGFNPDETNFRCWPMVVGLDGAVFVGATVYSGNGFGQGGTTAYVNPDAFTSGSGQSTYLDVGGIGAVSNFAAYNIMCRIPAKDPTTGAASSIIGYRTWSPGS